MDQTTYPSLIQLGPYATLIVALIVALWGRALISWGLLAALLVWSISVELVSPLGAVFVLALCAAALGWKSISKTPPTHGNTPAPTLKRRALSVASFSLLFILSVLFLIHKVPGFKNTELLAPMTLGHAAGEYYLRMALDKPLFALVILAAGLIAIPSIRPQEIIAKTVQPMFVTLGVVLGVGLLAGFIAWDPKMPPELMLWAGSNFFFTCLAEEIFFRGLIQERAQQLLSKVNYGPLIAVTLTAALFGVSHAAGGAVYVLMVFLAGLGYGWTYYRTRSIIAATGVHFVLNITHLLLFTYPHAV